MSGTVPKPCFVMLALLTSILLFTEPANASSTIYILEDGTITPDDVPISTLDRTTYTLTGNIYDSVVVERSNITIDGAGFTVQGSGLGEGFRMFEVVNVTIKRAKVRGFTHGIYMDRANDSFVLENSIAANSLDGIDLYDCSNIAISGNNITSNEWYGIGIYYSLHNTVERNSIIDNYNGMRLYNSSHNIICKNNIEGNFGSLALYTSSDNLIFHNNFTNSTEQVYSESSTNIWNDNYPYGGNFWTDYDGVDLLKGPSQDENGSDGIGDTAYLINENNQDKYPLIKPHVPLLADLNGDRIVNILDITIVALAFGSHPAHERWSPASDLDNNNVVNIIDLSMVAKDFGKIDR